MMGTPAYIIGILFASLATFLVWLGYTFLIPMFSFAVTPIANEYPTIVNNNPTYVNAFDIIVSNLNVQEQDAFVIMGLGIISIFLVVFAYRRQFTSDITGQEEDF